jgi:phosphotransferase system HPr (HPr) family protein
MLTAELRLRNPGGLSAGPAAVLERTASRFQSELRLWRAGAAGEGADLKSRGALLAMGAEAGARVRVTADGPDEAEALAGVVAAVESGLGEAPEATPRLTRRERDILALLTTGLSRKQIAAQLGLAEATVRNHLSRLYRRLGVSDARQAVVRAFRSNLLKS